MKRITAGLTAIALWSVMLAAPFMGGCNGTTVAQQIVNWTPTIISATQTLDAVVATLDPAQAALILPAGVAFVAGATLLEEQAKTYLANPSATTLGQLQAQALAFQANVTTALLNAVKIVNPATQQKLLTYLNAAVTGVSAILALIMNIKGSTLTPASVTAPKLAAILPLMNRDEDVALIAQHEDISTEQANVAFNVGMARLQAAGL
jgi:hypothetical protein